MADPASGVAAPLDGELRPEHHDGVPASATAAREIVKGEPGSARDGRRPAARVGARGGSRPRFRRAVLAANRSADPRVRCLRRAPSRRTSLWRPSGIALRGPSSFPAAQLRSTPRMRPGSARSSSRWALPCWASVTECRRWLLSSAARSRGPRPASSAARRSRSPATAASFCATFLKSSSAG